MDAALELIRAGRYMHANQLAWGTSGNISVRLGEDRMLITASGTFMGDLAAEDLTEFDIASGTNLGTRKASKETPMHAGIYKKRHDAKAVLHASPFYATLMACSTERIPSELFIETMYYLEQIAYVEYFHPGTQELGEAVAEQAGCANVILMRNHGVVVFDDSVQEALMRLETLEMSCRMMLQAKASKVSLTGIPEQTVRSFLDEAKYKPRKRPNTIRRQTD